MNVFSNAVVVVVVFVVVIVGCCCCCCCCCIIYGIYTFSVLNREEGFRSLFNGVSMATTRGIMVTIGQLSFYDQFKQMLLASGSYLAYLLYACTFKSVYLFVCLFVQLSFRLSACLLVCLPFFMIVCLPVNFFIFFYFLVSVPILFLC